MKPSLPNRPARPRQRGFTLIATIMILALLVVLLVGSFSTNSTELTVASAHFNDYRAELALKSSLEAAARKAFRHMEKSDDFVVFRRQQTGNTASHLRPVVYYTAVPDGARWVYQPLISGARADISTGSLERHPGGLNLRNTTMDYVKFEENDKFNIVEGTGAGGWTDKPLNPGWEYLDFRPAVVSGEDVGVKPELSVNERESRVKGQDMRVRYCYWIEDLAGKLDASLAGNTDGPNGTHLRGQPALVKDQPRQAALFTLFPPAPAQPGSVFPNVDHAVSSTLDNLVINRRQYFLTRDTLKQQAFDAPVQTMLLKHLNLGSPEWTEREFIPQRPHIAASKHGKPKLALNKLIAQAESDITADGSDERHAAITELAEHIKACFPNFASRRAGGNIGDSTHNSAYQGVPHGKLMTTDEYVYSLAANIIDYADRDQTPSVDPNWTRSNTTVGYGPGDTNVPKYRGIDLQPFCVGYATRFLISDWTNTSVTAQVSVWVALWNPTDREIEGELSVRFTEGRTVLNGVLNSSYQLGSRPVLPHLNLPSKTISLGPNEFTHVPWYDVLSLTATFSPGQVTHPNFRLSTDDVTGRQSLFDGGYQIFWNGRLADRTRRPDNINRPYHNNSNPNDKAPLGGWFFACSGIGDSSQPASDPRGTLYTAGMVGTGGDQSGGRGYYMREAKYINNWFWGGGAVRTSYGDSYDPMRWLSDPGHATGSTQFNTQPLETETPDLHLQNRGVAVPPRPEKAPSHVKHPVDDYPVGYTGPGYYESIGELGFVFDPSAWTRTTGGGTPHIQGGGRTLRIGSPELAPFKTTPGARAADLLDILCLEEKRPMQGIVNLNSVSPEVARTLFAGMELKSERAISLGQETSVDGMVRNGSAAGPIYPPCTDVNTNAGGVFAAAVTSPRAVVLKSASDLASLEMVNASGNPISEKYYFGDTAAWSAPQSPRPLSGGSDPGLDDRGREEMFRRVMPLVRFNSRYFRIYLTAQVLDRSDKVVVTRSKAYDVLLEPVYDASGNLISQDMKITHEKSL